MDERYICYCGLYCGNCSIKAKIDPAAETLRNEIKKIGYDEIIINYIPGGKEFWNFLTGMTETGSCVSCKSGMGGDPACPIRKCASGRDVSVCALCDDYPCEKFDGPLFKSCPVAKSDNELIRTKGMAAWGELQDGRRRNGFTYQDDRP